MALHSRSEVQAAGRATQAPSSQRSVAAQSRSTTQSTQNPSIVEHTCRGHVTDEVQRVTATQAWRKHTWGEVQSMFALHATHSPATRSHTRPLAEQSRSDRQVSGAVVSADGVSVDGVSVGSATSIGVTTTSGGAPASTAPTSSAIGPDGAVGVHAARKVRRSSPLRDGVMVGADANMAV